MKKACFNLLILLTFIFGGKLCSQNKISLIVLGTIQDGGSPHIGCRKACCLNLFDNPDLKRKVVSLGLIDDENKRKYIFEGTPDFPAQLKILNTFSHDTNETADGIFLTHAHIGH